MGGAVALWSESWTSNLTVLDRVLDGGIVLFSWFSWFYFIILLCLLARAFP